MKIPFRRLVAFAAVAATVSVVPAVGSDAAAPRPTIAGGITPLITVRNGTATLAVTIANASNCTLTVNGSASAASCASLASKVITLPANPTVKTVTNKIRVTATGAGGTATKNLKVKVGPQGAGSGSTVAQVSAGNRDTCAVVSPGNTVYCWGSGLVTKPTAATTPALTQLSTSIDNDAAGYSCGVKADTTVVCWGSNSYGGLGSGVFPEAPLAFGQVRQVVSTTGTGSLSGIASVSVGQRGACAVATDGAAYCWGDYTMRGSGTGTPQNTATPVRVVAPSGGGFLTGVSQISVGSVGACAATSAGAAYCWSTDTSWRPAQVGALGGGPLTGVTRVSTGSGHSCAVTSGGTAYCWGNGFDGTLADGVTCVRNLGSDVCTNGSTSGNVRSVTQATPVKSVSGTGNLANVVAISAGRAHTCAADSSGKAFCWGLNATSQLGDGTTTRTGLPVAVKGIGGSGTLSNVVAVSAGGTHTCALIEDANGTASPGGANACWGNNVSGQIGIGSKGNVPVGTPVLTAGP